MKLITYLDKGREQTGVLNGSRVIPAESVAGEAAGANMTALIEALSCDVKLRRALEESAAAETAGFLPLEDVRLLAPIPRPRRNIFCLGKNYIEHALEVQATRLSGSGIPDAPIYFTKTAVPALEPEGTVEVPQALTQQADYESELAVIIGKTGRDIPKEQAEEYIFGYTILNDVSARDLQKKHSQWFKGKNLDTFCPMGPVIVTADELPFPVELDVTCRVNGELRQNANTRTLIFDLPAILSDLSAGFTLLPGDIISTGTPSGVGAGYTPPKFLKDGDVVECGVSGIGVLRNTVQFI